MVGKKIMSILILKRKVTSLNLLLFIVERKTTSFQGKEMGKLQ